MGGPNACRPYFSCCVHRDVVGLGADRAPGLRVRAQVPLNLKHLGPIAFGHRVQWKLQICLLFIADRNLVIVELLSWLSSVRLSVRLSVTDVLWLNGAR